MQVNGAGKQERQQRSQQASMQRNRLTSSCPAFYDGPSLRASHYMPKTTMRPSSWHIHSDNFGVWPYISSEYSREKEELAKQKRIAHALQMSEKDFIVPSSVLPVKGLCCFGNYEYDLNPYPVTASTSFCTGVHSACIHHVHSACIHHVQQWCAYQDVLPTITKQAASLFFTACKHCRPAECLV